MKDQQEIIANKMSLIKSPKLFRKIFRSTEDIRHGKATPLFARRKKGGGGKIYPKDDSNLKSPTTKEGEVSDGLYNGVVSLPRMGFNKSSPQVSFDEDCCGCEGDDRLSLPRIEASDNEGADRDGADNNNDNETATPTTGKKKKKRYRRFTKIYIRSKSSSKASINVKSQDDDKVYRARSGKMKDKALEISV